MTNITDLRKISVHGDANSELLLVLMEFPWQILRHKFGIRNYIARFDLFAQKSEKWLRNFKFHEQKFGAGITMDRSLGH